MRQLIKLTGLGAGVTDMVFTSAPIIGPGYDPAVDVAVGLTKDDTLYTQRFGNGSAEIVAVFTEASPLKYEDYLGNYNQSTRAQAAATQCLCNVFENIAVGALNSITAVIDDGDGGTTSVAVNIMNAPSLGFQPVDSGGFIGELKLRVQR